MYKCHYDNYRTVNVTQCQLSINRGQNIADCYQVTSPACLDILRQTTKQIRVISFCVQLKGQINLCVNKRAFTTPECPWIVYSSGEFIFAILSSLCKLIWRHWTYKMPVRYTLSSVWVRLSICSQLSIIQYMGLCVFSLLISIVMIERIYTSSYYHHQIGSMNYYPLFRVRSWNNGMCCMSLYILID